VPSRKLALHIAAVHPALRLSERARPVRNPVEIVPGLALSRSRVRFCSASRRSAGFAPFYLFPLPVVALSAAAAPAEARLRQPARSASDSRSAGFFLGGFSWVLR